MAELQDLCIPENLNVKDALKLLDQTAEKTLLVVDNEKKLLGTLSDGDIRRFILKGHDLNTTIINIYNKNSTFFYKNDYSLDIIKKSLVKGKFELIPIVDKNKKIIDFVTWDKVFNEEKNDVIKIKKLDLPLVIMAGGKGTRLEPFTSVLPKPLIPIGNKTILEIIIDEFLKYGVDHYYLMLNYKSAFIKAYFNGIDKNYKMNFVDEEEFLGTAGCLKYLIDYNINNDFIVSNCDIIVKADFNEALILHKESSALLTVISSIQHHKIPYGVVNFTNGGEVTGITEKPEYTFPINTGVYILNKKALDYIPAKGKFDMTDLIYKLIQEKQKVFTYPVNENDYIDIGQWEMYQDSINKIKMLK